MPIHSQFTLFIERRFGPYFVTQFLGALNDNIYKTSLGVLISFQYTNTPQADFLVNICTFLFILPFFLFSATAGELADRFEKAKLIRIIKFAEIMIMSLVSLGFYFNSTSFLILLLFLMGTQSSFFGPIKYSILPQHLEDHELMGGNGLVEMGTFISILLGTIIGGLLIGFDEKIAAAVSTTVLGIAICGFCASLFIPKATLYQQSEKVKVNWNPITETWRTIKIATERRVVFLSILGISWFWFYGAAYLTQLLNYNSEVLNGDEKVITLMLAMFSLGIGLGSILCEKLSNHKVEIGLVPFGAIGLTVFAFDLSFAHGPTPEQVIGVAEFASGHIRLLADLFLMGMFGGFYIVPLYVVLQTRSRRSQRSRVIAGNNIINAFFMGISSVFAIGLFKIGLSIPNFFMIISLMNLAVTIYLFILVPEFFLRFLVWLLISLLYRLHPRNLQYIPEKGAAIITSNHVSYIDPLLIMAASPRQIRFVMDHRIFKLPIVSWLFKGAKCIPIAPAKEDPVIKEKAFEEVAKALKNGELIGIFPEGNLSPDGEIKDFRNGIERILSSHPVPVIPIALQGMWGSFFSRRYGKAMFHFPRRILKNKVFIQEAPPIKAKDFSRAELEEITKKLRGDKA